MPAAATPDGRKGTTLERVYLAAGTTSAADAKNLAHPEAGEPPCLESLSQTTGIEPTRLEEVPAEALVLVRSKADLELRAGRDAPGARIEFPTEYLKQPRRHLSPTQPLARAIGPPDRAPAQPMDDPQRGTREGGERFVLDATAGWGQDAFLLACLGHRVIAVERHPVVFALLADAKRRALGSLLLAPVMKDRFLIRSGDVREYLATADPAPRAVYLDPMFPPKRKQSALPRKEVQLLRRLVGPDQDATEVASLSWANCAERLVVKRPAHASPLLETPTVTYEGKLVRYDVYRHPGGRATAPPHNSASAPAGEEPS